MATANMKDVKRRIKSVESTMQITKAMQLVASSKLRRAKERALAAQPFFAALYDTMSDISNDPAFTSVYTKKKVLRSTLFVVIAGDRGLAGGFNSNVLKLAASKIGELTEKKENVSVIAVGRKAIEFCDKRGYDVVGRFPQVAESLNIVDAEDISDLIIEKFRCGYYDQVDLVYTTFMSALTQEPVAMSVLPVEDLSTGVRSKSLIEYDPSPEEVFDGLVPQYLTGLIFAAVVDSFASEQAARRTAMESASDNAEEMINNLSLLYNRARQAMITQELTEISSASLNDEG
ncbi:F-type H+-transporting ATPase subunit gamma [Ruminococcaceae bacterium FB2012]|nr:F-type H+-transporting ATPase subunit gamma [Ruminococcaceae bacterium FB2012]